MRDLLQHVVEEMQARGDAGRSLSVQVQGEGDVGFPGFPLQVYAAFAAADGLRDLRPGHRPDLQGPGAEIRRQLDIRFPVADDKAGSQVIRSVQIGSEHPCSGFPGGGMLVREGLVNEDVVKMDPFPGQGIEHEGLARPEGFFGKEGGSQAVLVGDEDQFESQARQGLQAGDGSGNEGKLVQGVDLLVGGLHEDGPVPVDEEGFFQGLVHKV